MRQSNLITTLEDGPRRWSVRQSRKMSSPQNSTSPSQAKITDDCDECVQKELCPVYMGQECLLVRERQHGH